MIGCPDIVFGHKVNLTSGKSNLILDFYLDRDNPADTKLYGPTLDRVIKNYRKTPRDIVVDGGYASKVNMNQSTEKGLVNFVFNKIVGCMKNQTGSLSKEIRLKRWRNGIEANISNLKRGFDLRRCLWTGWLNSQIKVLWSVLVYNIVVMSKTFVGWMRSCNKFIISSSFYQKES